jgi:hypothetical protein
VSAANSSCTRKRHQYRRLGQTQRALNQHCQDELESYRSQELHRTALAQEQVRRQYGFVPDVSVAPFVNAVRVRRNCQLRDPPPLTLPANMAFHDLTPGKIAPPGAKSLLGLGSKFICTPKMTTGNMFKTTERLYYHDICLKVYFAGESDSSDDDSDEDRAKSKLFVKSKWVPPPNKTPNWVDQRTSKFFVRLQRKFKRRQASTIICSHVKSVSLTNS